MVNHTFALIAVMTGESDALKYKRARTVGGLLRGEWLGRRDSNPDTQLQRLQSYR